MMQLHHYDILSGWDPLPHDGNRLETLIQIDELLLVLRVLLQTTVVR